MDENARAFFDFMHLSYQRGLLDDQMALGDLLDANFDTGAMLDAFDEAVMDKDVGPAAEMMQGLVVPIVRSLTNAESIDAMRAILQASRPYLAKLIQEGGQKNPLQNVQALGALIPHLVVLLKNLAPVAKPYVQPFVRLFLEDSGRLLGNALNAMSDAICTSNAEDPELIGRIFTSLFKTLDSKQFGRAMEILSGGLLDQQPQVVRWTLDTIIARSMKRIARS